MYDTLIFDFFGVIYEDPLNPWTTRHGLSKAAVTNDICHLLDIGTITYSEYMHRLAALTKESVTSLLKEFQSPSHIKTGMPELLRELKSSYHIGLLTNTCSDELLPLLEQHRLGELFHEVLISAELGLVKPDAKIFHTALRVLDAGPLTSIFIDDKEENVRAVEKLGMTGLVFETPEKLMRDLEALRIDTKQKIR